MEKNQCPGCMRQKTQHPVCEHCGFDERVPNAAHQLPVGTVLQDRYVIGKVLGQGGFGITYIGWDRYLNIRVAIKEYYPSGVVIRESSQTLSVTGIAGEYGKLFSDNRERFFREAQTLARFTGIAQIVHVQNLFLDNNTAYIVMEYVEGITLKNYVKHNGGKISPNAAFTILRPVMEALSKVHEAGVVHRDISPDNIMLMADGSAKLLDFGAVREVNDADVDKVLTKSTEAILKHGFAPIEQYQTRGGLGPWTDVYALCATLYYCLTGKVPADAPLRVMGEEDVDWDSVPGLNPKQLETLKAGMTIAPRNRIRSVDQLCAKLFSPLDEIGQEHQTDACQSGTVLLRGSQPEMTAPSQAPYTAPVDRATVSAGREQQGVTIPLQGPYTAALDRDVPYTAPVDRGPQQLNPTAAVSGEEKTIPVSGDTGFVAKNKKSLIACALVLIVVVGYLLYGYVLPVKKEFVVTEFTGLHLPDGYNVQIEPLTVVVEGSRNELKNVDSIKVEVSVDFSNMTDGVGTYPVTPKLSDQFAEFELVGAYSVTANTWKKNVLMSAVIDQFNNDSYAFGSDRYRRSDIHSIVFLDSLESVPDKAFDVSQMRDGTVLAWVDSTYGTNDLYIAAEGGVIAPKDCGALFANYTELTSIDFNNSFHTEDVVDMSYMFYGTGNGGKGLQQLDLTCFDTSNVQTMSAMFAYSRIRQADFSSFDTYQVTLMREMFSHSGFRTLDLRSFDTSATENMTEMFCGCMDLEELDISTFDTSNVKYMDMMFYALKDKDLTIANFDTSKFRPSEDNYINLFAVPALMINNRSFRAWFD